MRIEDDATMAATTSGVRSVDVHRLSAGSIIAGRYRLVALLGKGGMGEVYRAEDLTLDQPVALKFLPAAVVGDPVRLTQFHNELRVARQVSHKNVVRLYDLGEADGRPFLTMEYVDGEDLGSLLRRIGRFPADKAVDIARQLCAGVAAAHERGVIHRDLKPANVMLDGDGNVRITDFGIATALRQSAGQTGDRGGEVAGTPQYMAPELLTGASASVKTDIYALGLILFEIFTGRRAYDAKTLAQLKELHETGVLATPSSIVRDIDPAVERVILRAVDRDAARRPGSALAVAAALPGGDPLAEALAAGETPSPDMLAAAGEIEAIPVAKGLPAVGALVAALAIYAWLSPFVTLADLVPLEKPPAVLADHAQQLLRALGYDETPVASAGSFMLGLDYPLWLVTHDETINRWNPSQLARGPALEYWYRTSPVDLQTVRPSFLVTPTDPPPTVSGMSTMFLDSEGRLQEFHHVPPPRDPPLSTPAPAPQWKLLFDAAGLSMDEFTPVEPEWTPRDFADTRAAWRGAMPGAPDIELRVEAAAYRGRVVSFSLVGPWSQARRTDTRPPSAVQRLLSNASTLLWMAVLGGAALLARYNVCANRADRRTAARLLASVIAIQIAAWIVGAPRSESVAAGLQTFLKMISQALLGGGMLWMLYLALEPYARRFWPDGLIGWTRLWSGRVRDPRIGRDILVGSALGAGVIVLDFLHAAAPRLLGRAPAVPALGRDVSSLAGPAYLIPGWSQQIFGSMQTALLVVMLFVGLRLIVRRTWFAVVIGVMVSLFATTNTTPPGDVWWTYAAVQLAIVGVLTLAIFRYGLLVTTVVLIVDNIPTSVPIVAQPAWAAMPGNLSMALVVALACFGYYAARAGQPLFGKLEVES
jgi:serine/threonine-protein kinase